MEEKDAGQAEHLTLNQENVRCYVGVGASAGGVEAEILQSAGAVGRGRRSSPAQSHLLKSPGKNIDHERRKVSPGICS